MKEALVWAFQPVRRLMLPGDPFFEEGDIQCNILRKQLDLGNDLTYDLIESSRPEFKCSVPSCHEYFVNVARFESHYKSFHWSCCRYCKKSLPSNYLLDIHILENHDTLFQLISLKKHMYKCLVESCPDKFSSEKDRKDHLVKAHLYPADFRFNTPSRTQRRNQRKQNASVERTSMETATELHAMDVVGQETGSSTSVPRRRLPAAICFGRGSARAFQRGSIPKSRGNSGRGRKNKVKKTDVHHAPMES